MIFIFTMENMIYVTSFKNSYPKPRLPKVGQLAPLGHMTDTQGVTNSKRVKRGAMSSKGATGGPYFHNLKLTKKY